jgi:hypothetical protein
MTLPTDFASFASGWNFTEANYSTPGSGGGTFPNLVSGQQVATRGATAPTFSSKGTGGTNLEGVLFAGASGSRISFDWLYGQEATLLLIGSFPSNNYQHLFGCSETGTARWTVATSSNKLYHGFNNFNGSASSTNNITTNVPFVGVVGWSPVSMKGYTQLNSTTAVETAMPSPIGLFLSHWDAIFGGTTTGNAENGAWLARALIFNRCLFQSDNTNLQSLITTEMASIGL